MNRIVVPLDGSELSERAAGLGVSLAQTFKGRLELVHVLEEPFAFDLFASLIIPDRESAERYLQRFAADLSADVQVSTTVLHGDPVTELLKATDDATDTMIVMSTHGRGGFGRLMLGSVSDKVLRGATVPIALVSDAAGRVQREPKTILVPLDGSSFSQAVVPLAIDLARRSDATLSLVQVCEPFWSAPSVAAMPEMAYMSDAQMTEIEQECITAARRNLDAVATETRAQGIRTVWEVRTGRPADEIIRAAATTEAELIVMSTHGRGGLRRLAMGSVANEVLHRGAIPILALPAAVIEREGAELTRVLATR